MQEMQRRESCPGKNSARGSHRTWDGRWPAHCSRRRRRPRGRCFPTDYQRLGFTTATQPGLPPGDVIFVLKTQRHESFERSGSDLLATVSITLSEALLGFDRIMINHLDGRGVRVASPEGKVITSGTTIILRNEGMPTYKNPDVRGNLYVVLEVEMPTEDWIRSVDQKA